MIELGEPVERRQQRLVPPGERPAPVQHLRLSGQFRRFPDSPTKGLTYYAITRALQMKFMRLPKSKVKIGQTLPEDYR